MGGLGIFLIECSAGSVISGGFTELYHNALPHRELLKVKNPCKSMTYKGFNTLAEEAGFEPAVGITPRTLSRRMT